jgi:alginate O-acetyltransferase complex protein AlgI
VLFNSYAFIFLFLPLTFGVYFVLNWRKLILAGKAWLVLASLFFYGYWNPVYIPLILASILFNYGMGSRLHRRRGRGKPPRLMLACGVAGNLALLGYYKYMDFFITNINSVTSGHIALLHIVLPLGISFFTFTQIAYLVDTMRGNAKEYSLLNYALFVTFFPHLLAGPIIHHKEMMPQFDYLRNKVLNYGSISQGLVLFFVGLFKKVIIADTIAALANSGFDQAASLTLIEAWATSLAYTLQLYFDFSGYTDMALGSSLLFNIKLPINFNSPYKSASIQDFWRRWHMTLSRFVRDYIYIPLGGGRVPEPQILLNILVTFFLVGLWHGAGWTFVVWGLMHGVALIVNRLWRYTHVRVPKFLCWFLTFQFVNMAWVFFRAKSFDDALKVLKGMAGMTGIVLPEGLSFLSGLKRHGIAFGDVFVAIPGDDRLLYSLLVSFILAVFFRNSNEMLERFVPNWKTAFALAVVSVYAILNLQKVSEFIYFNF